jgi:3-deoxy-D-manno-octulosonic-acid transferase
LRQRSDAAFEFHLSVLPSVFRFFYDTAIRTTGVLLPILGLFHRKARRLRAGRQHITADLARWQRTRPAGARVLWMHCASLGEFEQGRPVLEAFREAYPDWQLVLTFFSPSGYEVRKGYPGADCVTYLPADTPANAHRWAEAVRPDLVIWVKYEFWYHHLRALYRRGVPVVLIAAIFRPDQLFFKPYGSWYRQMLGFFAHCFVQNDESLQLLRGIGLTACSLGGDTRFDRVVAIADQRPAFSLIEAFKGTSELLVCGSVWEEDWRVIEASVSSFSFPVSSHRSSVVGAPAKKTQQLKTENRKPKTHPYKVLIAPHELDDAQIERWRRACGVPAVRYSEATPESARAAQVLFLDTIGMLSGVYAYAEYAFIGGAYGAGLHNVLEAAVYGVPLFFGDRAYHKFAEAQDLLDLGAAFAVRDRTEWERLFSELRADPARRQVLGTRAAVYVRERTGATRRVMDWVRKRVD